MAGALDMLYRFARKPADSLPCLRFEAACLEAQEMLSRTVAGRPDRSDWASFRVQVHHRVTDADQMIAAAGVAIIESAGTGRLACYGATEDVFRRHAFTSLAPTTEVLALPRKGTVTSSRYYILAFHELAHWTGAADRLNRESMRCYASMQDEEEFVAEFASLILSRFFDLRDPASEHQVAQAAQNYLVAVIARATYHGVPLTVRKRLMDDAIAAARGLLRQAGLLTEFC